jgi:hypothetical protein
VHKRLIPPPAARRTAHLPTLCALLALACGDSAASPGADAARDTDAASSSDAGSTAPTHDAAIHDAPHGLDAGASAEAGAPSDASAQPDATRDASTPNDAAPPAPDASEACRSYCTCMASNCADKVFTRGCLTECAAQSHWDLPCRELHCGLVPAQPDNDHCTHAKGMVQCLDL